MVRIASLISDGYEFESIPGSGGGQGGLVLQSMESHRVRHDLVAEQQHFVANVL